MNVGYIKHIWILLEDFQSSLTAYNNYIKIMSRLLGYAAFSCHEMKQIDIYNVFKARINSCEM